MVSCQLTSLPQLTCESLPRWPFNNQGSGHKPWLKRYLQTPLPPPPHAPQYSLLLFISLLQFPSFAKIYYFDPKEPNLQNSMSYAYSSDEQQNNTCIFLLKTGKRYTNSWISALKPSSRSLISFIKYQNCKLIEVHRQRVTQVIYHTSWSSNNYIWHWSQICFLYLTSSSNISTCIHKREGKSNRIKHTDISITYYSHSSYKQYCEKQFWQGT